MKGDKKTLIIAILVLLLSVTFSTYAIYRTNYTGNATIKTAAWTVKLKDGSGTEVQNLNFDFDDITWTSLTGYNDTIAPGSTGTISYTIDATGSEVDVDITSSIDTTGLPTGLTVTMAGNATQTIAFSDSPQTKTITLNVAWAGAESDDSTKDSNDLSKQGQNFVIPVTVTAKQSLVNHAS